MISVDAKKVPGRYLLWNRYGVGVANRRGRPFAHIICRLFGKGEMRWNIYDSRICKACGNRGNGVIHIKCIFDWMFPWKAFILRPTRSIAIGI